MFKIAKNNLPALFRKIKEQRELGHHFNYMHLVIAGAVRTIRNSLGGFVHVNSGTITDCLVNMVIEKAGTKGYPGGFVYRNTSSEKISNCIENNNIIILEGGDTRNDTLINSINYIKDNEIDYRAEIDEIVMIVDRDKKSFTDEQYDFVCNSCKDNGIKLVVTNPCFEFWLLLHFDVNSEEDFDMEKMLENPKEGNNNYCFGVLRNVFKNNNMHYRKNKFDVKNLMSKIDNAIKNEKQYCEDVLDLKNNIGSNIGKLITELRNTI